MSLTGSNLIDVTFAIDAWGQAAGGVWPHLALKLDGATIGQATVNSSSLGRYTISAKVAADGWEAMNDGSPHIVSGFSNKLQAALSHITPDTVLAKMHARMADPREA